MHYTGTTSYAWDCTISCDVTTQRAPATGDYQSCYKPKSWTTYGHIPRRRIGECHSSQVPMGRANGTMSSHATASVHFILYCFVYVLGSVALAGPSNYSQGWGLQPWQGLGSGLRSVHYFITENCITQGPHLMHGTAPYLVMLPRSGLLQLVTINNATNPRVGLPMGTFLGGGLGNATALRCL